MDRSAELSMDPELAPLQHLDASPDLGINVFQAFVAVFVLSFSYLLKILSMGKGHQIGLVKFMYPPLCTEGIVLPKLHMGCWCHEEGEV